MANLKKYNLQGKELGTAEINDSIATAEANAQMVKDYIVALRKNLRQWSACTRLRSEVNHSKQKPHPQKGTGRARQGRLSSPQYKGGGVVFGPRPKFDQHVGINKKERRSAIRALLADKIKADKLTVVDSFSLEAPKTKTVKGFMQQVGLEKRTLFLSEANGELIETEGQQHRIDVKSEDHKNLALSVRNIPKVAHSLVKNINGYDVMIAQNIVISEKALEELNMWLG